MILTIRSLLKWAEERGSIKNNPSAGYRLPPRLKPNPYCFTTGELQAIYAHAGVVYLPIFQFLALTGLRRGELCHLAKDDLKDDLIHIRAKEGWKPKHGRARVVPLCPEAKQILAAPVLHSTGPWAFAPPQRNEKPFAAQRIYKRFHQARVAAGLTQGSLHTLRHVFCSHLANHNLPAFQVMKMLGHGSMDIVLAYYSVQPEELLASFQKVTFTALCQVADTRQSS